MKRFFAFLLFLAMLPTAAAEDDRTFFAMDTVMTLRAHTASDAVLEQCEARVTELEGILSVTDESSEIAHLNSEGEARLSGDALTLLAFALEMGERTDGALDVTLYPIIRAWGFTTGDYRVPGDDEIAALLEKVDYRRVTLRGDRAALPEGMMVDLGGVAKGYAADVLKDMLLDAGETSALVDLGGNLYCLGGKEDGSDWRVGIRNPKGEGYCGALSVSDCAVVTSGNYERFFEAPDGAIYGHIFDPRDGYPADGDLLSVTVTGKSAMLCDALSTALFVMGSEGAAAFIAAQDEAAAIMVTRDGRLLVSSSLKRQFQPMGEYARYDIEWIGEGVP